MAVPRDPNTGNKWWSCLILNRHQVASESVHGARLVQACLAEKYTTKCSVCVEESKECKCTDHDTSRVAIAAEHHVKRTSSFAHSVINMIGMLIGSH
jgi:hypothetical protein